MSDKSNQPSENNMDRRNVLKGLATVPVFGLFLVNLWRKMRRDSWMKSNLLSDLVQEKSAPAVISSLSDSRHLNIGIIGYGGRGSHLVRGAGFATVAKRLNFLAAEKTYTIQEVIDFCEKTNSKLKFFS
ncbi:MAG: hypothetical protein ABGX14_07230, partial [bacterium]